jgi:hypothetical protein
MDIDKPIKNSNIWSSIVDHQESDTDSKHDDEPDNDYCRATRVDGHACNALRYKNELFCYSHLMSQKTRPRGRPKKVAPVAAPALSATAVSRASDHDYRSTDAQVAPVAFTSASDNVNDHLILKLTDRLKMKIDQIDNETKLLLKLLL